MRKQIFLIATFSLVILLNSCDMFKSDPVSSTDKIEFGDKIDLINTSIGSEGGIIRIDKPGISLDGLAIVIPKGAYNSSKNFNISYSEIKSHKFGKKLNPIIPMIHIDNGGEYSDSLIILKIPIQYDSAYAYMCFYYYEKDGSIQPIMPLGIEDGYFIFAVNHFSDISITKAMKSEFRELGGYHTGFMTGVNSFPFPNESSYNNNIGMCGGMSYCAGYIYSKHPEIKANTYFDNYPQYFSTPDISKDDSRGRKLCAMAHTNITDPFFMNSSNTHPYYKQYAEFNVWCFIYALWTKDKPVVMLLDREDNNIPAKHVILAIGWKIEGNKGKIQVYDPNFVPSVEQEVIFDFSQERFEDYKTGLSSIDIDNGSFYAYNQFIAAPDDLFDTKKMDMYWSQVANNTIGDGDFPSFKISAENAVKPTDPIIELTDITTEKDNYVPYDKINIRIVPSVSGLNYNAYAYIKRLGQDIIVDEQIGTIDMTKGNILLGIGIKADNRWGDKDTWTGFYWFTIKGGSCFIETALKDGTPISKPGIVNIEYGFKLNTMGTLPPSYKIVWNLGDGSKDITKNQDTTIKYTYNTDGTFKVTAQLFDISKNSIIGESKVFVTINPESKDTTLSVKFDSVAVEPLLTVEDIAWNSYNHTMHVSGTISGKEIKLVTNWMSRRYNYHVNIPAKCSLNIEVEDYIEPKKITGTGKSTDGNKLDGEIVFASSPKFRVVYNNTTQYQDLAKYITITETKDVTTPNKLILKVVIDLPDSSSISKIMNDHNIAWPYRNLWVEIYADVDIQINYLYYDKDGNFSNKKSYDDKLRNDVISFKISL